MRIAFVMPAFNEEELLAETVDGCLPLVDALVIVDDGSTDETGRIADDYARRYPEKIEVIHQENKGLSTARNVGIQAASGEYVAFTAPAR